MERGPDHKRQMERVERRRHRPRRIRRVVCVALALLAVMVGAVVVTTSASETSGQPLDPAVFADGSCMAFAPTAGDRGQTVFLDAGHGGIDPGGVGTTESGVPIDEATASLPVELGVMAILRTKGYRVVVSRTTADTVVRLTPADRSGNELSLVGSHDGVAARDICANEARAQVLVGIYYDAGASAEDAGSLTAYDAARPIAPDSRRLATLVQHDVVGGWTPRDGRSPMTRCRPTAVSDRLWGMRMRRHCQRGGLLPASVATRLGGLGLLRHSEPDAWSGHRAAVSDRSL